jgi:serine/threonine protein kinase
MRSSQEAARAIKRDEILRRCQTDTRISKQISSFEISELVNFILSTTAQARLARLPLGLCTRFDKHTLAAKRSSKDPLLSFGAISSHNAKLLPRTILAMRESETVTMLYILLGSKLAATDTKKPYITFKDKFLKQHGSFKQKTNVLCVAISDNFEEIRVELKALIKVRKHIADYMSWVKISVHTALIQHTLAQHCPEIIDSIILNLDDTFSEDNVYIVCELGNDLHSLIKTRIVRDSDDKKLIIKNMCRAICFMHRFKIVHRDIKLENSIIVSNSAIAKLIDFDFLNEAFKGTSFYGTPELLPNYILGQPIGKRQAQSKHSISSLKLTNEEKLIVYEASRRGSTICDIWAFGICLFEIFNGFVLDTPYGANILASYKKHPSQAAQIVYQILCPEKLNCYLLASDQELEDDLAKPLSHRKYLSMDKIYQQLFGEEYILDEEVVKGLRPRMQELIASRPKLAI